MTIAIILLFLTHLIVPLLLVVGLWRGRFKSKVSWLASVLGSGAYVLYFFLAGTGWVWVSYYLRVAVPVVFLLAVLVSLLRVLRSRVPWWRRPGSVGGWASLVTYALLAVLFGWTTALAAQGFSYGDARAVGLSFPLGYGVWDVVHGGDSPVLNYHNVDRSQRFALDVVRLNAAGTRASGLYPHDPRRYAGFGTKVSSPCAGKVVEIRDGLPDRRPPDADRENLAGNHVVVRCPDADPRVDVLLAHLQRGSVTVEESEEVEKGRLLGRLGNSGNTSEPHLHVHAVRTGSGSVLKGEGVPMEFDGRFLVRSSLVF